MENGPDLSRLTAEMFIAYVTNNKVEPIDVENVVRAIRTARQAMVGKAWQRHVPSPPCRSRNRFSPTM